MRGRNGCGVQGVFRGFGCGVGVGGGNRRDFGLFAGEIDHGGSGLVMICVGRGVRGFQEGVGWWHLG